MESTMQVVRLGLNYERTRLEVATHNLAIANVAHQSAESAQKAVAHAPATSFANMLGSNASTVEERLPAVKVVHDPGHPLADQFGNVYFASVDPTHEMATLVSATRAYEANVRSFNTLMQMSTKALEIGGRR